MNTGLRTRKTFQKYKKFKSAGFLANGCNLCKEKSIKEFKYWKILNCRFPWDRIAKTNHLLIPKRCTVYKKLNNKEKNEFELIKATYVNKKYEILIETTDKEKSIPGHFHIHLMVIKNKI